MHYTYLVLDVSVDNKPFNSCTSLNKVTCLRGGNLDLTRILCMYRFYLWALYSTLYLNQVIIHIISDNHSYWVISTYDNTCVQILAIIRSK